MMETVNNIISGILGEKPAQQEVQLNSQGVAVPVERSVSSVPTTPVPTVPQPKQQTQQVFESSYEDVSLGDTPLAGPVDTLYPPTDDSGIQHEIISWGHVLKSTHDLARWSEKTGARRVNGQESIDSVSDLIIGLEAPKAQTQQQQDGNNNNNNKGGQTGGSRRGNSNGSWRQKPSQIISCGPVLKSTHDAATWSEKSGAHAVNTAMSAGLLDEVAANQGNQKKGPGKRSNQSKQPTKPQSGTQAGGSLQSGFDTQAGSHIQLEGSKGKETPEKVMQEIHLHV